MKLFNPIPFCFDCWNEKNPDMPVSEDQRAEGAPETCGTCGEITHSGIYVRGYTLDYPYFTTGIDEAMDRSSCSKHSEVRAVAYIYDGYTDKITIYLCRNCVHDILHVTTHQN